MLIRTRFTFWFDGVLLFDQGIAVDKNGVENSTPWSTFSFEAEGRVVVEDVIVMNRPKVQIVFNNAWGEHTQTIHLEDEQSVQVSEMLYDSLGRAAITTRTTRITRTAGQSLLTYYTEYVQNTNPADSSSVWHTGLLHGDVARLNPQDRGVAYTRIEYEATPLDTQSVLGLPGPDFSVTGRYAKHMSRNAHINFLSNLFPISQGYRQQVEVAPNGSRIVLIFDKNKLRVARYVHVPGCDHTMSTFEYDAEQRLVKILPPMYHERVNTYSKITPWQTGDEHLTGNESQWQHALGTFFNYDAEDNLIRKTTPDAGTTEYLYNKKGERRFMVSLGVTNQTGQVVYFNHDAQGEIIRTGHLTYHPTKSYLTAKLNDEDFPSGQDCQQMKLFDFDPDPLLRGILKRFTTLNWGESVIEELRFNARDQVTAKRTIAPPGQTEVDSLIDMEKIYQGDKLRTLIYPVTVKGEPFHLVHQYDLLGRLISLGLPAWPTRYATFTYHGTGQLATERHQPSAARSDFTRSYSYNSPGFLEQLSDPFLTERIAYTDGGYGQDGFGDGMVMRTTFIARWQDQADARSFRIKDDALQDDKYSSLCVRALKRLSYLSEAGRPLKQFIPGSESKLPLLCRGATGNRIAQLFAEKQSPQYYGHHYAYGNHQELIKAKYFTEATETLTEALQPGSFSRAIPELELQQSHDIWKLLTEAGYVVTDQRRTDWTLSYGKRGKAFISESALTAKLATVDTCSDDVSIFVPAIVQLLTDAIGQRKHVTDTDFQSMYMHWKGLDSDSHSSMESNCATRIYSSLFEKGFLSTRDPLSSLDENFTSVLASYRTFIPDIVRVLSQHFAHALGEHAFDVESYDIDANGNHRLFYTGFSRYSLNYHNATNKIEYIEIDLLTNLESEHVFEMIHDAQGNVIQALHKGIKTIEYNPTSQRTSSIKLADGCTLRFYYDAQGERVLKQVFTADRRLKHEVHYLRDEKGQVLADRRITYFSSPLPTNQVITVYIYGPRGLLGFIREDEFYSVITDHSGSIRLVVKQGQVVAAYDYLPYGQLMRQYGNDQQAHIAYRYTGQEWDEETSLYNYHARLYDPAIGRFYQPDPQSQYASPYKYAGNSPVSLVDPDGELALIIASVIAAIVGMYLGGAAANNRWNPAEWDPEDGGTWLGIVGGGIAGGLLPLALVGSAGAIAGVLPAALSGSTALGIGVGTTAVLAVGGSYLTVAASQGWDPSQWEWDRPQVWSGLFEGLGTFPGLISGNAIVHKFAKHSTLLAKFRYGKHIFLATSYTVGVGVAYGSGVMANDNNAAFWEWNWTEPATWHAVVNGYDSGSGWPQNTMKMARGIAKLMKSGKKINGIVSLTKLQRLKSIAANARSHLHKVALGTLMAYYMGSAANEDFTQWNNSWSTYEEVLNGIFFGKDLRNSFKFARAIRNAKSPNEPNKISHRFLRKLNMSLEQIFSDSISKIMDSQKKHKSLAIGSDNVEPKNSVPITESNAMRHQLEPQKINNGIDVISRYGDKMQAENVELNENRKSAILDREVEFLHCRSRRRRQAGGNPCSIHVDMTDSEQAHAGTDEHDNDPNNANKNRREEISQMITQPARIPEGAKMDNRFAIIEPQPVSFSGDKDQTANEYINKWLTPHARYGWSEKLSNIGQKTPNIHSTVNKGFWPTSSLALALISDANKKKLSITDVFIMKKKVDFDVEPNEYNMNQERRSGKNKLSTNHAVEYNDLVFVEQKPDQRPRIIVRTFAVDPAEKHMKKSFAEALMKREKLGEIEMSNILKKCGINDGQYVYEHEMIRIRNEENNAFCIKQSLGTVETVKFAENDMEINTEGQLHIVTGKNDSTDRLQKAMDRLFSTMDTSQQQEHLDEGIRNSANIEKEQTSACESFFHEMLNIYADFTDGKVTILGSKVEAGFHAFLYGHLSLNVKYEHHLDVYVERNAGSGTADLMFISRSDQNNNKNWHATPIIVELKADGTSAKSAIEQIKTKGYLFNLSMRTLATRAIVVGINSNKGKGGIKAVKDANGNIVPIDYVAIEHTDVPEYTGVIDKIRGDKESIEIAAMHLSKSLSGYINKATSQGIRTYINALIGELAADEKIVNKYIIKSTEKGSVLIFKDGNDWCRLNIGDKNELKRMKDIVTDMRDAVGKVVDMELITNRGKDEERRTIKVTVTDNRPSGQDGDQPSSRNHKMIHIEDCAQVPRLQAYDSALMDSITSTHYSKDERIKAAEKAALRLIHQLEECKTCINSEGDLQAILLGILNSQESSNNVDGSRKIVRAFHELNHNRGGRLDIGVVILQEDVRTRAVQPLGSAIIELKYKGPDKVKVSDETNKRNNQIKLEEGFEQAKIYVPNWKALTDDMEATVIAITYIKDKDNKIEVKVKADVEVVDHTSHGGSVRAPDDVIEPNLGAHDDVIDPNPGAGTKRVRPEDERSSMYDLEPNFKRMEIDNTPKKEEESGRKQKRSPTSKEVENYHDTSETFGTDFLPAANRENNQSEDNISSGSSRLEFWPLRQACNTVSTALAGTMKYLREGYPTFASSTESRGSPPGPTLLDMGDHWLAQTNMQGNIMWATLLLRRLTGTSEKRQSALVNTSPAVELEIAANDIVSTFVNHLLTHAATCGIVTPVRRVIDETDLRPIIRAVREKLARSEIEAIHHLLCSRVLKGNVGKIAMASTQKQVDKLARIMVAGKSKLHQELVELEKSWSLQQPRVDVRNAGEKLGVCKVSGFVNGSLLTVQTRGRPVHRSEAARLNAVTC